MCVCEGKFGCHPFSNLWIVVDPCRWNDKKSRESKTNRVLILTRLEETHSQEVSANFRVN